MSMLRFQAPDRTSYVRSITNQIGPDVAGITTKRTLPTFTDANAIYVAKTGNDSNAGTSAAPKLTISAATSQAFATSRPYVAIKDSGVYEEIVSGTTRSIYAMAGRYPTIKYPSSATESYVSDAGVITALNYYGNNEYSLRGAGGVYFTGTINDYTIVDGIHWITSTNGIWYSYIGYVGWYQVNGTAGSNFKHLVSSNGNLFVIKTGTGIYRVTKSGIALEVTDANVISLCGNDEFIGSITNVNGKLNARHYTTLGWMLKDISVQSNWYYTAYTGFNRVIKINGVNMAFVHVRDSDAQYYGPCLVSFPNISDTAGVSARQYVDTFSAYTGLTFFDVYHDTNRKLIYYLTSPDTFGKSLQSMDYAIITAPKISSITTPVAVTRFLTLDDSVYLGYSGGLYKTADWITFTQVATTANQTPVTIFDSDPGRVIIGNTWTAGCSFGLYIWRKYVIHRVQTINGITLDGNNLANVGLFVNYANGEHYVAWNCEIKNCTVAGFLDGGMDGQRTHVANCILTNNGIGFKEPDFASALPRLYYCYVHGNEYGIYAAGYSEIFGPEIHNCVITNNSVVGVWYQGLGRTIGPVVLNVYSNIIYGNGFDFILKNRAVATAVNAVYNNVLGTFDFDANVNYYAYSQADPLLLPNGDYQDIAGGYPFDSIAKTYGAGIYSITSTSTPVAGLDYTFDYLPETKSLSWKPSNFQSSENAAGEYSESWDGMKRTISLTWPDNYFSTKKEFYQFIDLLRQEDAVFRFGDLDAAGTGWKNQLDKLPTIEECDDGDAVTTKTSHPTVGVNEFAGWYLSLYDDISGETIFIRIGSHNESDGTVPVTFVLDRTTYPAYYWAKEGSTMTVAFLPVKIDKSSAFGGSQFGFFAGADPLTGFSLTLREVEHE